MSDAPARQDVNLATFDFIDAALVQARFNTQILAHCELQPWFKLAEYGMSYETELSYDSSPSTPPWSAVFPLLVSGASVDPYYVKEDDTAYGPQIVSQECCDLDIVGIPPVFTATDLINAPDSSMPCP